MRTFIFLFTIIALFVSSPAYSAKVSLDTGTYSSNTYIKEASDTHSMRNLRRVGVGGSLMGNLGLYGMHLEMNFQPEWGILLGYGGGPHYQSLTAQYKYVLSGKSFTPYAVAGFSKWYSVRKFSGPLDSEPGFIEDKLISDEELRKGLINQNLIYPGFGLQYVSLNGEWAGFSMFLEVDVLTQLFTFKMAPTASLGMTWYF